MTVLMIFITFIKCLYFIHCFPVSVNMQDSKNNSKNVRFVYKGLVNAIISLPTELFLNLNINLCGTVDLNNIYQRKTIPF